MLLICVFLMIVCWASFHVLLVLSCFNCAQLFETPWTVDHQTPLSMEFSRQEYWSELPCPPPGDLPEPEIKPMSLTSPALASGSFTTSTTWEIYLLLMYHLWRNVHSNFLSVFYWSIYLSFFLLSCKNSLYMLNMRSFLQIFSLFPWVVFSLP